MTLIVVGWPLIVFTAEPHHKTFSSRHAPPFQPSMEAAAFRSICVLWQLFIVCRFHALFGLFARNWCQINRLVLPVCGPRHTRFHSCISLWTTFMLRQLRLDTFRASQRLSYTHLELRSPHINCHPVYCRSHMAPQRFNGWMYRKSPFFQSRQDLLV